MEPFIALTSIKTINGESIELPKVSWKTESKVLKYLSEGLKDSPEIISNLTSEKPNIVAILPQLLSTMPDTISKITAEVVGKEEDWVGDNLDTEIIIELLYPFFKRFVSKIMSKLPQQADQTTSKSEGDTQS